MGMMPAQREGAGIGDKENSGIVGKGALGAYGTPYGILRK